MKLIKLVFFAGTAFGALAGLFAGASLGATFGLLFAPKEGKKLREDMKDQAETIVGDVQTRGNQLKQQITEVFASTTSKTNGAENSADSSS